MVKATTVRYAATPTTKVAFDSAEVNTEHYSAIAWHPSFVAKAMSPIEIYEETRSPLYYGDVFSAQFFFGGTKLRGDSASTGIGTYALIQAA
jgi:hypothetical protein